MNALTDRRILLVGGPGGVGKTTLAAALGIRLASLGHRTVVLTVDPAKRLATALGFTGFSSDLQKIALPDHPKAQLWASMLDSQHYFDRVIERFATTPEQKEKILNHRLYRTMVDSLGGSHEYAAMERVLEFAKNSDFDRVIVDTPPTQNALDLLNAPQKLADFMDNSVLKWFQGKGYFKLFQGGTKIALKLLGKVLGGDFLDSLSEILSDLEGMQAGFRNRNLEVLSLMRSPATAFLLVTGASEARFLESVEFAEVLKTKQIELAALILNRLEPKYDWANVTTPELAPLADYTASLHQAQRIWVQKFKEDLKLPTLEITKRRTALHDIASLSQLGQLLIK